MLDLLFPPRPKAADDRSAMMARIDAASTATPDRKHWSQADNLSADAAYDPGTRYRLRNRSRYEAINNCYAKASVNSGADDMIGVGPLPHPIIPGDKGGVWARTVKRNFKLWSDASLLPIDLHVAEKSVNRDGECYGLFDTDERLRNPVKFAVRWVEAEMCGSPFNMPVADPYLIDGIRFDRLGKPVEYYFLTHHPGSLVMTGLVPLKTITVPAERVVHWYTLDRFGQHRNVPETTPALPLYGQLRRYTLATLTAAEFASMLAGIMKTKAAPDAEQVVKVDQWDLFELVRGALLTLPEGWEATQFKSENPPAAYGEFKREILNESGRSVGQPLNVVSGNSSGYNFSSGRLDHLPYQRRLKIRREHFRLRVLDPIFRDGWYPEARLVGQVPAEAPPIEEWSWVWRWPGFDSIDQNKDALADDTRIKNGTSTYSEILGEYGEDWQEAFDQLAVEKAYAESKGLPWPVLAAPPTAADTRAAKDPGAQEPQPGSLEQTVQFALEQAGVDEDTGRAVLDMLQPTFASLRAPHRNGHHRNGVSR